MRVQKPPANHSLKGVSPVIASVILIAITLAIAGMFSLWATSFVQTRQTQFDEQLECTSALEIDRKTPSLTYSIYSLDDETPQGLLKVIVINKGTATLVALKALITYPNEGVNTFEPDPQIDLEPGKGKLILIEENPEKPLRLRFFSEKCSFLGEVDVP